MFWRKPGRHKIFYSMWYPYKNLGFLFFSCCFCMNPIWYPYTSGSLRRPHPAYPIGSFAHTFSTLRKRPLLSEITYGILTQAGPKNLPKKVEKNRSGSFLDHRACAVPTTSLQNDSTYGKLKSEGCGTTANFALLRDLFFGYGACAVPSTFAKIE